MSTRILRPRGDGQVLHLVYAQRILSCRMLAADQVRVIETRREIDHLLTMVNLLQPDHLRLLEYLDGPASAILSACRADHRE